MELEQKNRFLNLRKQAIEKEFCKMNNMQKKAIFNVKGPVLILAGAGSGKTTVLINRIANIIKFGNAYYSEEINATITDKDIKELEDTIKGNQKLTDDMAKKLAVDPCKPWKIMAITFTNKAAGELKERLNKKLGEDGLNVLASTFHSMCSRILRIDAELLGYEKQFTVYDSDDAQRVIKDIQKELNIDDKKLSSKSILSVISNAKNKLTFPDDLFSEASKDFRLKNIAEVYKRYQKRLKEANAMDFDDLLVNTVLLFERFPEVLKKYQDKYEYILVDEYQDTNLVQYRLIELLSKKYKNLCVVGDDDQSIYKFRGATIENILNFESTFPNALVIKLEQNYRSTKNILKAANEVINNNQKRKGKTLWTDNDAGELIELHTCCNEQGEAIYIKDEILNGVSKGASYSDFAILYRMNSQSNVIEKVLVKSGVPYRIIGGHRFYERKEIRDIIAYLSVINNTADEVRLKRIINQPKRSIGDKTIATASNISNETGLTLFEVLGKADEFADLQRSQQKLKDFHEMITEIADKYYEDNLKISDIYSLLLEKTGYIEAIKKEKNFNETRIENINELLSNIIKYEEDNGENASLEGFLEEVSLFTDIDNYDESCDSVVLMTMHCAKGLEFPTVFLPGFEEEIFPGIQAIYDPEEIEEERRLAYVGMTRAKSKLYITNADCRMIFGKTSHNKASRFSSEIPEECVNKTKEKDWHKLDSNDKVYKSFEEIKNKSVESARKFNKPKACVNRDSFRLGETVKHKTFGKGYIVSLTPMGNDILMEISFEGPAGVKKLMANFAKLERI